MSATATQQPPTIPPRPSRSQDKESIPKIPPRPINRRIERSISPNPDRFAPSPLNDSPFLSKSPRTHRFSPQNGFNGSADPIDRSISVELPSVGEEGKEYAGLTEELSSSQDRAASPEHTRTVGEDIKLHAPKPSLPAQSAKARVAAVTRTDSDRAAAFGIGKPSSEEPVPSNRSLKKKASTVSQLSTSESHIDDEHGIPEIGQQVPMYPNAGDVQAPSPAPALGVYDVQNTKPKHHSRKTSARGFVELPPGSYGLHGHGVVSQDRLEKAYYDKHPELLKKEHTPHHHDRPNDFSMSSDDLNKIVRDTASRSSGNGHGKSIAATPSEQIGWQAIESTSRVASPRPGSTDPKPEGHLSPLKKTFQPSTPTQDEPGKTSPPHDSETIHIDEPGRRRSVMFSEDEGPSGDDGEEHPYNAPILAEDEVAKDPSSHAFEPAVEPPPERRGSAFEMEEPRSRPTSRPASIYKEPSFELYSTPLEDVKEYEPLFPEDEKGEKKSIPPSDKPDSKTPKQRFPSSDIWEDAPNSVHYTAEVSAPEAPEEQTKPPEVPPRETETPAHAFARQQEELAEKESKGPESFLHRKQKPIWTEHQPRLASGTNRPSAAQRFPSRDVWEDAPDSHQLEATVSTPQQDGESSPADTRPQVPQRPARKPTDPSSAPLMPERPKPRQTPSDDGQSSATNPPPTIPDRPKPQVPARPAKAGPTSEGKEPGETAAPPPKTKPAVPVRPMGSKIAAFQAGFMSDLNKRLQLGPQAPKKEEPAAAEPDLTEEKEKAPLADARKGRARGPQRRAPGASPSPAAVPAATEREKPVLTFSSACTVFSIDPDRGLVNISSVALEEAMEDEKAEEVVAPETPGTTETKEQEQAAEVKEEDAGPAQEETKTLATNMAGEALVQAHVETDEAQNVEPAEVEEGIKD